MNKTNLVDTINHDFQMLLRGKKYPDYHLFFESLEWWNKVFKKWVKDGKNWKKKDIKNMFNYEKLNLEIKPMKNCVYKTNKIISHDKLVKLYKKIHNKKIHNFNMIDDELKILYKYNLPSTIKNIDNIYKKDSINIIIIGAGPVGLFTALYYNFYYREKFLDKKINIVLIDNRTYKEGIRLPYTRTTEFNFDINEFQIFIKNIFCWDNFYIQEDNRAFNYINTLENLLYIEAYNQSVNMYFTKTLSTYEEVEKFALRNKFDYIIDCTGGRLRKNINLKLNWNEFSFKKKNYEVKLDNNKYKLYNNNKEIYDRIISIYLFDKKMNPFRVGNFFGFLEDKRDIQLVDKFNGKCLQINDYIRLSKSFHSESIRYLLSGITNVKYTRDGLIKLSDIGYVKFTSFKTLSDHSEFASKKINNKLTYIGLGETLGHTQFGIHFGMASSIRLSKHICHLIGSVV
jgi:hypothetical protein